jgi:hypothetical protein
MRGSLYLLLAVSLALVACAAKSAPIRIEVKVSDAYSGPLRLKPCWEGAQESVSLDDQGNGETSVCPYGDLEIVVIKPTKTVYIMSDKIQIDRTGDGIPVGISSYIP